MSGRLLEVCGLGMSFNGITALENFSCSLGNGEVLGLAGPNGAGKTTLFNVLSGFIVPNCGSVVFRGVDITGHQPHRITNMGISRTFQGLRLVRQISVLDNVLLSFKAQSGERLRNVFFNWKLIKGQEATNREEAMVLLEDAGLSHKSKGLAEELSYGQQKLLTLLCCLAAKSDILLLDEPVAGLDPAMTETILESISGLPTRGKSVIMIEHNLEAVMNVCDRAIFMDAGTKVSEGSPEQVLNDPRVIEAYIS